jgi:hypothetical protein
VKLALLILAAILLLLPSSQEAERSEPDPAAYDVWSAYLNGAYPQAEQPLLRSEPLEVDTLRSSRARNLLQAEREALEDWGKHLGGDIALKDEFEVEALILIHPE